MTEQRITSRKNPLLQQVKKLLSSRKAREEAGLFAADGVKLLAEAVRWYPGLDTVILSDGVHADVPESVRLFRVPEDVMASISPMESPQGALFLCRLPEKKAYVPQPGCLLLDGIQDDGSISEEARNLVMQDLRAHFRPEFLNRLDETIMFKPLTKDNIGHIVDLLLKGLNKRLADQELTVELSPAAKQFVIEGGYDPVYGARPLKRFVQKEVETSTAKLILGGQVSEGDTILLDVENGGLKAMIKPGVEVVDE